MKRLSNLERAVELDPRNSALLYQLSESLLYTRRYEQAALAADSAVAIEPDDAEMKVLRGIIEFTWKADTRLLHHTLDSAGENIPGGWMMLMCALAERDAAAANRALTKSGERTWGFDAMQFSRSFGEGLIARMTKRRAQRLTQLFFALGPSRKRSCIRSRTMAQLCASLLL